MTIIDCQSHWYPREFFEAHVGRESYPRAERTSEGYVFETSHGRAIPVSARFFDLDRQFEDLATAGADALISSQGSFSIDALPAEEALVISHLVNEARAEAQRRYPDQFFALAALPMQDPDAAIPVLDHAVRQLGLRGVCINSNIDGEPLSSERFRPVYAKIDELGVPLFLHPAKTILEDKLRRYGLEYSVGYMFDTSIAALDLVFAGVPEDCKRMKIVHPHLGGTLPFVAGRIDHEYRRTMDGTLPRLPSEYLRTFYTDTVVARNPGALKIAKDFYGLDHVMFASDYPYWSVKEGIEFLSDNLEKDEAGAVLGGNAQELLGLAI